MSGRASTRASCFLASVQVSGWVQSRRRGVDRREIGTRPERQQLSNRKSGHSRSGSGRLSASIERYYATSEYGHGILDSVDTRNAIGSAAEPGSTAPIACHTMRVPNADRPVDEDEIGRMVDHVPANTNNTVLRCAGIERSFGGLKALKGVTLDVHRGEIFGLASEWKRQDTMVNVVTSFYPPNAGSVTLFGEDITRLATARCRTSRRCSYLSEPGPVSGNERSRQHHAWPSRHMRRALWRACSIGSGLCERNCKPEDCRRNHRILATPGHS